MKTQVGKWASEMGVTNSLKYFKHQFTDRLLKESTVRTWKVQYEQELKRRCEFGESKEIDILTTAKRGHPPFSSNVMDKMLQNYIKELRENAGVVNAAIVQAAALGIVKDYDSNLWQLNGGHTVLSKSWAKSFLSLIEFMKRRATTRAKVKPADFDFYKG